MEILFNIVSFMFLIALVLSPVVIVWRINKSNVRHKFRAFLVIGIFVTVIITLLFVLWGDTSYQILLEYYGYKFDAMDDTERFAKVSSENFEKVRTIEKSVLGISWPVKAIFSYIYYFPYFLIACFVTNYVTKKLLSQTIETIDNKRNKQWKSRNHNKRNKQWKSGNHNKRNKRWKRRNHNKRNKRWKRRNHNKRR